VGFVYLAVPWVVSSVPVFILGQRRRVDNAGVAFVPFIGPTIVMLWSIGRSGWLSLLAIVPLVNIVFSIWLLVTMPHEHGRTRWWALALIVPLIGMLWYALTLDDARGRTTAPEIA
jgi:uncharacterized membrane protein YhaH (DUF805 family)